MNKKFLGLILAAGLCLGMSSVSYARGGGHGGGHGGYHSYSGKTASTYNQSSVKGYYRSNGTYVQGHYRSAPDHNSYNNWSTKGNYNPHTGAEGTHTPYPSKYYQGK